MNLKRGDFVTDGNVRGWYIGSDSVFALIEREDGKGHDGLAKGTFGPPATYIRKGRLTNNKSCFWFLIEREVKRIPQLARDIVNPNVSYQLGSKRAKGAVKVGDVWITAKEDPEVC